METSAAAAADGARLPIYISSDDEDEDHVLFVGSYSSGEIQIQQAVLRSFDSSRAADAAHSSAPPSGGASTSGEPSSLPDPKGKRKLSSEEDGPSESTKNQRRRSPFKCIICMEKFEASEQFLVSFCAHAFCNGCIGGYVAAKVSENVAVIGCPDPECKEGFVEMDTCRDIIPPELFDRWSVSLCELALGEKKYYCPFKDCSALLINDNDGAEKIMETECPHCHRMFCARCRVPWHDGIKCKDYENGEGDLMFKELAGKKKWQRCPQCRIYVEKSQGCMFMTCSVDFASATSVHPQCPRSSITARNASDDDDDHDDDGYVGEISFGREFDEHV